MPSLSIYSEQSRDSKVESISEAPFHVNWNITYVCNFNCKHCYSRIRQTTDELSLRNKLRVAENIVRNKVFSVNLGGGEPLLDSNVFLIIEYLAKRRLFVALSSNGWNIKVADVRQLASSGLNLAILSLDDVIPERHDSLRGRQGSHASCLKSIERFVSHDITVRLSTVVTSTNVNVLGDIADLALQMGCAGVEFKRLRLKGNATDKVNLLLNRNQELQLYEQIHKMKQDSKLDISLVYNDKGIPGLDEGCPCGKTTLAIAANGDISACVYHPHALGNALIDDLGILWRNSVELQMMRKQPTCQGAINSRPICKIS
jgi:MoaA/NifB/PqqE/SkfB family radical SAM enzyme